jgi:hypothetical protein
MELPVILINAYAEKAMKKEQKFARKCAQIPQSDSDCWASQLQSLRYIGKLAGADRPDALIEHLVIRLS